MSLADVPALDAVLALIGDQPFNRLVDRFVQSDVVFLDANHERRLNLHVFAKYPSWFCRHPIQISKHRTGQSLRDDPNLAMVDDHFRTVKLNGAALADVKRPIQRIMSGDRVTRFFVLNVVGMISMSAPTDLPIIQVSAHMLLMMSAKISARESPMASCC